MVFVSINPRSFKKIEYRASKGGYVGMCRYNIVFNKMADPPMKKLKCTNRKITSFFHVKFKGRYL